LTGLLQVAVLTGGAANLSLHVCKIILFSNDWALGHGAALRMRNLSAGRRLDRRVQLFSFLGLTGQSVTVQLRY
jgi:hypothetical protein